MSYSHHALRYTPPSYRRPRRWLRVVRAALIVALVVGTVLATAAVIARMRATDAQLARVHLQGMAVGMTMCGGR